jgi:hypothetical protein
MKARPEKEKEKISTPEGELKRRGPGRAAGDEGDEGRKELLGFGSERERGKRCLRLFTSLHPSPAFGVSLPHHKRQTRDN